MLTVSELSIYPVKSLGGIALDSAALTDRGFAYDRRWMLVDANNRFISQREYPSLALLRPALSADSLHIFHKTNPGQSINVPLAPPVAETMTATVWDDLCAVQPVSSDADEWLSEMLSMDCRLVYMPEESQRKVDKRYAANEEITSLSDGYPVLLIGQASLDDLNRRLALPLPMNRFRPNIVFSGGEAFEEDTMAHFRIGGIDFYSVKPCARCVMTTIDQETAIGAKEPLKTLAGYRNANNKIYFGQNILYRGSGEVRVGDRVEVMDRKPPIQF
jgi:hypothetical protein